MKIAAKMFRCFNKSPSFPAQQNEVEEGPSIPNSNPNPNFQVFTYEQLKSATQGFKNKIGEGGFGSVFKGRLIGDDFIAVKAVCVEVETMKGEREFVSEIAALSLVKHPNLITLRGCCVHGTHRLLVYDYMPHNSLNHTFLGTEQKRAKFSWAMRKQVLLGIAKALCYLHEEVNPHIVHRDIKASNILLDHDFTPKLADFGLARLFRDEKSYISTRVAGTLGYLSPEYAYTGHLTRKSDVYSFGVVLLEIVSGRPIVDYHQQHGEEYLVQKAWELYNGGKLLELVDTELNQEFSPQESILFLKIGLLCVQEISGRRPAMSRVLKMLNNDAGVTEDTEILRPGLVADLMDVKIRSSSNFTSTSMSS